MKRYIIHLNVEYYEPKEKEKKYDISAGIKNNEDNSIAQFIELMDPFVKSGEVLLPKDKCKEQSFTVAVYLDINEEKIEKILEVLRTMPIVATIEPLEYEGIYYSKNKISPNKEKSISRFLK